MERLPELQVGLPLERRRIEALLGHVGPRRRCPAGGRAQGLDFDGLDACERRLHISLEWERADDEKDAVRTGRAAVVAVGNLACILRRQNNVLAALASVGARQT